MNLRDLPDDPMFRDASDALGFAFYQRACVICKSSGLGNLRQGSGSPGRGLTPHERHAQAAMVLRQLDELPVTERAFLVYWHSYDELEQGQALSKVVDWLMWQGDVRAQLASANEPGAVGISRRALTLLVHQYHSDRHTGIGEVRRVMACRKAAALAARRVVFDRLDCMWKRAHALMEERLQRSPGALPPSGQAS